MWPEGGWGLGYTEGEDSGRGEVGSAFEGVESDAGEVGEFCKVIRHGAEKDGAVSGREGERRIVLKDDRPGGGIGAVPKSVGFGILRDEVAGFFAEVGDGSGFGKGEWSAGIFFFKTGHGLGEEWTKAWWICKENCLEGEASGLVEEADVTGGELGCFRSGIVDDGDADTMAVADEGDFERTEVLKMTDGLIGAENNHGICLGDPVIGKIA